jgi:hypothetical protein
MKPCFSKRKLIAWLALGELDARGAQDLRAHLETCTGCRRYFEAISGVARRLTAADTQSNLEASASFHRTLMGRLREQPAGSFWSTLAGWRPECRLSWRVALTATAVLLILAWGLLPRHRDDSSSRRAGHPAPERLVLARDLSPTVANYQQVASRSLDDLDELLGAQARRRAPRTSSYTASIFAVASAPD